MDTFADRRCFEIGSPARMSDRARHTPWSKKIVGIAGAGTETLDTPNDRLGRRKTVRRRARSRPSPAGFARRATTGWVPSASLGALSGSAKPNAMDSSSAAEANPLDPQSETTAARGSIECFAWRALLTSTIVEGSACNTGRPDAVAPRLDDAGRQPGGFHCLQPSRKKTAASRDGRSLVSLKCQGYGTRRIENGSNAFARATRAAPRCYR